MDNEDGMETCARCNGKKYIISTDGKYKKVMRVNIGGFKFFKPACPKCDGEGKTLWINNVFQTEPEVEEKEEILTGFESGSFWLYKSRCNGYPMWIPYNSSYKDKPIKNWKHWSDRSRYVK